jgi:regulator of ribonuclease activity A
MNEITLSVADLCDGRENDLQVLDPSFKSYGGKSSCSGIIKTIKVNQNPKEIRAYLSEPGNNCILVIDADANSVGAVVGDNLAKIASDNSWQGIIVNGYIRDTKILKTLDIAIWALGTCPRRGIKSTGSQRNINLSFGSVDFEPGHYLYADEDGVIISNKELL